MPRVLIVTPYIFSFISRPTLLIISKLSGEHSRGTKRSKGFCVMIGQTHKQTEIKLYIKRFVWSQLWLKIWLISPFLSLLSFHFLTLLPFHQFHSISSSYPRQPLPPPPHTPPLVLGYYQFLFNSMCLTTKFFLFYLTSPFQSEIYDVGNCYQDKKKFPVLIYLINFRQYWYHKSTRIHHKIANILNQINK